MGDRAYQILAVASFDEGAILRAHREAEKAFGTLVSSLMGRDTDGYRSFSIADCGCCAQGESNEAVLARQTYKVWLRAAEMDRPRACVDWIEVEFNEDLGASTVVDSSSTSSLTIDSVAVLAATFGLSLRQLLPGLCLRRAVTSTLSPTVWCLLDELWWASSSNFSPALGSKSPPIVGQLALELPAGQAFEAARLTANYYQRPISLIDPTTRALSGVAFPAYPACRFDFEMTAVPTPR